MHIGDEHSDLIAAPILLRVESIVSYLEHEKTLFYIVNGRPGEFSFEISYKLFNDIANSTLTFNGFERKTSIENNTFQMRTRKCLAEKMN
jgi:hypothetical protein